jgi:hypothetical protein
MEQHYEDLQQEKRLQALREGLQKDPFKKAGLLSVHLRS